MKLIKFFLMVSVLGLTAPALAADFDGSQDLLCASLRAVDCTRVGECSEGSAEDFDIPQFFTVNFKDKTIQATRPDQTEINSAFQSTLSDTGKVIFQGIEGDRGWTAALSQDTGRFVLAVSGEDVTFSLFAACTPKS